VQLRGKERQGEIGARYRTSHGAEIAGIEQLHLCAGNGRRILRSIGPHLHLVPALEQKANRGCCNAPGAE
jgi:hypothetical protein